MTTPTEPRVWKKGDAEPIDVKHIRDVHGDVWTRNHGGAWESPETMPCGWDYLVKKWAPVTEVAYEEKPGNLAGIKALRAELEQHRFKLRDRNRQYGRASETIGQLRAQLERYYGYRVAVGQLRKDNIAARGALNEHLFRLNDAFGIVGAEEDIDPYEAVASLHTEIDRLRAELDASKPCHFPLDSPEPDETVTVVRATIGGAVYHRSPNGRFWLDSEDRAYSWEHLNHVAARSVCTPLIAVTANAGIPESISTSSGSLASRQQEGSVTP